jgi:hypothetical protein
MAATAPMSGTMLRKSHAGSWREDSTCTRRSPTGLVTDVIQDDPAISCLISFWAPERHSWQLREVGVGSVGSTSIQRGVDVAIERRRQGPVPIRASRSRRRQRGPASSEGQPRLVRQVAVAIPKDALPSRAQRAQRSRCWWKRPTVDDSGGTREITVEEALQNRTYQDALAGKRMAVREVVKWIIKREAWLEKNAVKRSPPAITHDIAHDPTMRMPALLPWYRSAQRRARGIRQRPRNFPSHGLLRRLSAAEGGQRLTRSVAR